MKRTMSLASVIGITFALAGLLCLGYSHTGASAWSGLLVLVMGLVVMAMCMVWEKPLPELESEAPATDLRGGEAETASRSCLIRSLPGSLSSSVPLPAAAALGDLTSSFTDWFDRHEFQDEIWPAFDRWLRDALGCFVDARRIRCWRVLERGKRLQSLPLEESPWIGSPPALIEHVLAGDHRYVRGGADNGALMERLASDWHAPATAVGPVVALPDWLLPVTENGQAIGLISIGELDEHLLRDAASLHALGNLLILFWRYVATFDALATARRTDRASGVLNRLDLAAQAGRVLQESAAEGEPVVVIALAIEGVRRLDDEGQWELRNWLMQQVGLTVRGKLRSDDLVGRFSDDRFVAVLRRLDISLGRLISQKLMEAVSAILECNRARQAPLKARCGLAAGDEGMLDPVLTRAFDALQEARLTQQDVLVGEPAPRSGGEQQASGSTVSPTLHLSTFPSSSPEEVAS